MIKNAPRALKALMAFILFSLLFLSISPVVAQTEQPAISDDEVNAIAKDLFCPVCESTPLDVCATQACADWREVIRVKLSQGQSAEDIKAYFAEQYGARALAEPPREGFTLAVWILPIVAVAVGIILFSRYLRALRAPVEPAEEPVVTAKSSTPEAPGGEPALDDYEARIEREL